MPLSAITAHSGMLHILHILHITREFLIFVHFAHMILRTSIFGKDVYCVSPKRQITSRSSCEFQERKITEAPGYTPDFFEKNRSAHLVARAEKEGLVISLLMPGSWYGHWTFANISFSDVSH